MIEPSALLLITGTLVLLSVVASRLSDRIGVPALIVFLAIGMLAGAEGPGGIEFESAETANLVGMIALAFILFSGGLDTNWRLIRPVLARGVVLSTLGVSITAGLVGLFAWAVLGFPLYMGLLLGAIISSTDAAAVFSVLRQRGVSLKGNLKPLLELESGSNDPMAIFLTLSMTQVLTQPEFQWMTLLPAFVLNMAGGALIGLGAGWLAKTLLNRIRLDYEGLYPVLSMSMVLVTFGLSEILRCNGFLAVYLCGIILNSTDFTYQRSVMRFHDGLAWLMQIALFLVLGLLVFPSELAGVALKSLLAALFLMLVARPAAVALGLWGSAFSWRERALTSWTGLRGAVPIVLATFPLMAGYEGSDTVFNVIFFIVVTSVLIQGTLLMPVARWLKVDEPIEARPRFSLEIERGGQAQGETREIEVLPNMAAVGRTVADLDIPPDVLILLIGRGDGFVVPRGQTRIEPYDTLLMLGDPAALRNAGDAVLSPRPRVREREPLDDPLAMLPDTTDERFLSRQIVVVGYGRVGRRVCDGLEARNVPFVVAEQNREIVERLRARGIPAVTGDASTAMVLAQAHVARAALLIIATPDTMKVRKMAETAKALNPSIEIVIRTHSEMEANLLKKEHVGQVFIGEEELAKSIIRFVFQRIRQEHHG
jgi:potassium/hydrogen antiporter